MKIGFIGLGIMGKPMAKNLLKAGYTDLMVNNHSQAAVQELQAAGATGATQQEIGAQCDVVITMLPNSPQVKEVAGGQRRSRTYETGRGFYRLLLHQPGRIQGNLRRTAEQGRRNAGCPRFRR